MKERLLAELDPDRYVSQSVRGTIHVEWEFLSLHFESADFILLTDAAVAKCLQQGAPDRDGQLYRLHLNSYVLEMPAAEFWQLSDLLSKAALNLRADGTETLGGCSDWLIEVRDETTPSWSALSGLHWMN